MDRMAETVGLGVGDERAWWVRTSSSSRRSSITRMCGDSDSMYGRYRFGDEAAAGGGDWVENSLRVRRLLLVVVWGWSDGCVVVGLCVQEWRHVGSC
jgi:hypothetical protein